MLSNDFKNSCIDQNFANKVCVCNKNYPSFDSSTIVVTDSNIKKYLPFGGNFKLLILPDGLKPEMRWVNYIRSHTYKTIVAFGGGTINDLCKYSSYLDATNFITCPTTPSVNGYSSSTASIIKDGIKNSFQAHLPLKVYICLDILSQAPMRLILSGFSEVLCRFTTQPDWLLSHLLLDTEYSESHFHMMKCLEEKLFLNKEKLLSRNGDVIQTLIETLLLSGVGMNLSNGSYPASQGEHQIVHTLDMYDDSNKYFHGEKVGVAAITMAKIQNLILNEPLNENRGPSIIENIYSYYDKAQVEERIRTFNLKHRDLNLNKWPEIAHNLSKRVISATKLHNMLSSIGAATTPEEVGWNIEHYNHACEAASAMRNRFTFLDLLPYSRKFCFS